MSEKCEAIIGHVFRAMILAMLKWDTGYRISILNTIVSHRISILNMIVSYKQELLPLREQKQKTSETLGILSAASFKRSDFSEILMRSLHIFEFPCPNFPKKEVIPSHVHFLDIMNKQKHIPSSFDQNNM